MINTGHGKAFDVLYVRIVDIVSGIPERCTDIYRHVCMGVFSCRGAYLMEYKGISGMQLMHDKEGDMMKIVMLPDEYGGGYG